MPGPPSGDPIESLSYANTSGSPMSAFLAVEHLCGDPTVPFRVVTLTAGPGCAGLDFEDGETGETPIFVDKQIWGHPAAKGAIAVGAAFYGEIDSGGALDPPPGQLDGPDDLSGFGFTDALRPIRSLDPTITPLIDDLEFDLDGGAFFSSPPSGGTQRLQANDTLLLENGDFTGLEGIADSVIFADGFESGDTSSWSNSSP